MKAFVCSGLLILFAFSTAIHAMETSESQKKLHALLTCAAPFVYTTGVLLRSQQDTNTPSLKKKIGTALLLASLAPGVASAHNAPQSDAIETNTRIASGIMLGTGFLTFVGGKIADNQSCINAGIKLLLAGPIPLLLHHAGQSFVELLYDSYR